MVLGRTHKKAQSAGGQSKAGSASRYDQVLTLLSQIGDRLKRSEAEREELWQELKEYRRLSNSLEERDNDFERILNQIEKRILAQQNDQAALLEKQARIENIYQDNIQKITQAELLTSRIDDLIAEQAKLSRRLEKEMNDRNRMMRKISRLEERVAETQDAVNAKAMVLLTDKSMATQSALAAPSSYSRLSAHDHLDQEEDDHDTVLSSAHYHASTPWWRKPVRMQALGIGALMVSTLLAGWVTAYVLRPETAPQTIVQAPASLAKDFVERKDQIQAFFDDTGLNAQDIPRRESPSDDTLEPPQATQNQEPAQPYNNEPEQPAPQEIADFQDDNSEEQTDKTSDQILNAIEPASAPPPPVDLVRQEKNANEQTAKPETIASVEEKPAETVASEDELYDPVIQDALINKLLPENDRTPIAERIEPDSSLPPSLKDIESLAFKGDAEAQHDLAAIYTAGHGGTRQSFDRAAFWFQEAAKQGIANAQYNLGVLHHQGMGVDLSISKAIGWYEAAARLGHPEAQYNLGIAHIEGIGTAYDPERAVIFFERAAAGNIIEAAYNLGLIYENGLLGEAEPEKAIFWYKFGMEGGNIESAAALDELINSLGISKADVNAIYNEFSRAVLKKKPETPLKDKKTAAKNRPEETSFDPTSPPPPPKDLASDSFSSLSAQQSVAMMKDVQSELMRIGLYPGPADGIRGPMTDDSIRAYQDMYGLEVNGEPSYALINHIRSNQALADLEDMGVGSRAQ